MLLRKSLAKQDVVQPYYALDCGECENADGAILKCVNVVAVQKDSRKEVGPDFRGRLATRSGVSFYSVKIAVFDDDGERHDGSTCRSSGELSEG